MQPSHHSQHSSHARMAISPSLLQRLRQRSAPLHNWLAHEWGILTGFVVSLFLFLVLFSYDPADPGFFSSGASSSIHNWGDATGAWLSSFLLFMFGVFAYVLPFGVAMVGWVVFRMRIQNEVIDRRQLLISASSLLLMLSAGAGLASMYLDGQNWAVALPYSGGGMWGYVLSKLFIGMVDRLAATLLLLLLFALSFSWMIGVSWLLIMDVTGEVLWLTGQRLKMAWFNQIRPALFALGDTLADKYQQWRRGERVWPTRDEWKVWTSTQWTAMLAFAKTLGKEPVGVLHRPVGEHYPIATNPPIKASIPAMVATQPMMKPIQTLAPTALSLPLDTADSMPWETEISPPSMAEMVHAPAQVAITATNNAKGAQLPSLDLLDPIPAKQQTLAPEVLQRMGEVLEQSLKEYKINAEVVGIIPGPVVTMFELQPAPGVRVGAISNLARDLARSMSVMAVRVVDIIPGKSVIGIEMPNPVQEAISFREVLSSDVYQNTGMILPMVLGKDTSGRPMCADLAKMPHALVAGQTGSGKSVGVNAMIVSLLYHATPDQVKFIMIDPKVIELSAYEGIPHLLAPVVTDMSEAANALRWCIVEMERRYQLMSKLNVRNIAGYNEKVQAAIDRGEPLVDPTATTPFVDTFDLAPPPPTLDTLPYIVVIVDEFADMFMVIGKKVEELIARLAQKARAAGIHLILATQRPSVDVVTGLIKANIPTRISFKVTSKIDSRTILDQMGADQLLGRGDMLYLGNGMGVPQRVHGPFVSDEEVHRVVAFLKTQGTPNYQNLDPAAATAGGANLTSLFDDDAGGAEKDALYDQAVEFVVQARRVSVSSVQRRFKIGYNRAARIVEAMEVAGLVSPQQTNGNREVLVPDMGQ